MGATNAARPLFPGGGRGLGHLPDLLPTTSWAAATPWKRTESLPESCCPAAAAASRVPEKRTESPYSGPAAAAGRGPARATVPGGDPLPQHPQPAPPARCRCCCWGLGHLGRARPPGHPHRLPPQGS